MYIVVEYFQLFFNKLCIHILHTVTNNINSKPPHKQQRHVLNDVNVGLYVRKDFSVQFNKQLTDNVNIFYFDCKLPPE